MYSCPIELCNLHHLYALEVMPNCAGCNQEFSQRGYANHLEQTNRPACVAICNCEEACSGIEDLTPQLPFNLEVDEDSEPLPFEGDFFGDYAAIDFADLHTGADMEGDSNTSNDDSSKNNDKIEVPHWEASPATGFIVNSNIVTENMDNEDQPSHVNQQLYHQVEVNAHKKTFVVPFPGDTAGQSIS